MTPQHVTDADLYRADPQAPRKRRIEPPLTATTDVTVFAEPPNVSQPFTLSEFSKEHHDCFVVNNMYWMKGQGEDGTRVWLLQLKSARFVGRDGVALDFDVLR